MRRTPSTLEDGSVLRSRQVVLAAAAAGAAALLIGSTLAVLTLPPAESDSDGDGIPDSVEAATQRNVVAASVGDEFSIVSRLASAPFSDQFQVSYEAGTFFVSYQPARGSDSSYQLDLTVDGVTVSPGASLGLDVRINTTKSLEYGNRSWDDVNEFADGEAGINVTGGPEASPATVFFSWSKSAIADSLEIPVSYSNFSTGVPNSYELYLAYPLTKARSPVRLVHDPVLGVDSAAYKGVVTRPPELQGDLVLYAGSLAAAVILVALTVIVADRRRKKREE